MKMKGNMRHYTIHKFILSEFSRATILLALALLVPACRRQPQPGKVESITFQSGEFNIVGDLRLREARRGPFPVVLFVHGDAPGVNRTLPFEVKSMAEFIRRGILAYQNLNL